MSAGAMENMRITSIGMHCYRTCTCSTTQKKLARTLDWVLGFRWEKRPTSLNMLQLSFGTQIITHFLWISSGAHCTIRISSGPEYEEWIKNMVTRIINGMSDNQCKSTLASTWRCACSWTLDVTDVTDNVLASGWNLTRFFTCLNTHRILVYF